MSANKSLEKNSRAAQRRAVAHLAKTCMDHGHYADLYAAFQKACPDLARKHWESAGRDDALAGAHLGMGFDSRDHQGTVLDAYLFGDSAYVLRMIITLNQQFARIAAMAASRNK